MPRLVIEITPRIAELLDAGVISITSDIYGSGKDTYGRVTAPHPRLGVYPHQSMTLVELEASLEKVKLTNQHSRSFSGDSNPSPMVTPTKKGQTVSVTCDTDPEIGKVPRAITIAGVKNSLPKASLCWKDLQHLSDDQLNRRLLSIGKEIGNDKAVSRIASGSFASQGKFPTLYKWWEGVGKADRWTLMTTSKLVGRVPPFNEHDRLLSRLGVGQYPFRGTDRPLEDKEDIEEEETELEEAFARSLQIEYDSE
jgi:hypothetical protein